MVTYKFLNVIEKCIDCGSCFAICKDQNKVPHGTARVQIVTINEGRPGEKNIPVSCMHCTEPPCEAACPTKAIQKRAEDGIVTVDKNKCIGCGYCGWACPFGAPHYPHELPENLKEWDGIMDKCTLCVQPFVPVDKDRDPSPRCALFCSTKARLGGDIVEVQRQYSEAKARNTIAWQERV
ncbi:MAG: 4Fe-4S dicluster domain-containing protein [Methanophagales archaeon]|nr:4Fe-4S dicluster domain-containing protein [Methanophagales archaeon]